jgi:hypothetical protein
MYLGKKRQVKILICFLFITLSAASQTGNIYNYHFEGDLKDKSVISGDNFLTINYRLAELNLDSISDRSGSFYRIAAPGHSRTVDPGKPELPVLSRLIAIPEGAVINVRISEVKSKRINPSSENIRGILFPSQRGETKQQEGRRPEFFIDRKIYSSGKTINSDTVRIEPLGKIRGKNISNLIISPIRYNPRMNFLEVITSMKIDIMFSDNTGKGTLSSSGSGLFDETFDKGILNYYPEDLVPGFSEDPIGMIILTDTTFKKQIEPFISWKTQKGFKVTVLYRGDGTTGSTYTELKEAISREYSAGSSAGHAPEYLLIIGDIAKIPYYGNDNITDLYYGEFDGGGDYLPEMYIGRIPAPDTSSVKSAVEKILQYERFEFADTNKFYEKALVFAGKDATYANYMNGQVRYAISNYLNADNKIKEFHFFYPEGATKKDSILKLISNGTSFVNYTGHGSQFGWLHVDIKSSDIKQLKNKSMYPLIISNACRTAQYDDTTAFGNKMVLSRGKGAIGFIGCSNDSYWDEDFIWAVGVGTPNSDPKYYQTGLGAYDRLFHTHNENASDWYISSGQINYAGNLAVSGSSSLKKKYYWETYTLLGDPSLIPYTGTPRPMNASLPDTLPNGIKSLSVTIEPYSYIAISHSGQLWDATHASPSGSAVLEMPGISNDSALIVVTGQNRIPIIRTVYFADINKPYLNLSGSDINDSGGNKNGLADYSEDLFLRVKVSNLGKKPSTNLSASITSTSPWVTIITNSVSIGTLAARSEIVLSDKFNLKIADDIPDLGIITINLTLKDSQEEKSYKIDFRIHSPALEIVNCLIDDSATGNNNNVADPGEVFTLIFQVRNHGSSNTSGQITVSSLDDKLEILDSNVKSGILQSGTITGIPVTVKLSQSAQHGDYISFLSNLDCSPYIVDKNFQFRVGRIRESFESASFEVFPWINLSSKPWIITSASSFDGIFSARSGSISHNSSSVLILRTYFPDPDTLKFYYKVSSELNYDYFQFNLNGSEIIRRSGETNWVKQSVPVSAGYNRMEWIYKKDNSVSQGSDAVWIDLIDFSGSARVNYIQKDLEVARIVSPVQKEIYGQELVTVKVLNVGTDTLDGFNLAYSINNRYPVIQNFKNKLAPYQDSVTISFDKRADMDLGGLYEISVFGYENADDYRLNDTLRIKVENEEIEESATVFPNPFIGQLNVSVNSRIFRRARIILTNLSGKVVFEENRDLVEGENELTIDTSNLSPSMYILHISASGLSKAVPLIKLKR